MNLELSEVELEGLLDRLEERLRPKLVERKKWLSAAEVLAEYGVPDRSIRDLVTAGKVTKSDGLGVRATKYLREDFEDLLAGNQIKSRTTMAREVRMGRADAQKVTKFPPPQTERRAS